MHQKMPISTAVNKLKKSQSSHSKKIGDFGSSIVDVMSHRHEYKKDRSILHGFLSNVNWGIPNYQKVIECANKIDSENITIDRLSNIIPSGDLEDCKLILETAVYFVENSKDCVYCDRCDENLINQLRKIFSNMLESVNTLLGRSEPPKVESAELKEAPNDSAVPQNIGEASLPKKEEEKDYFDFEDLLREQSVEKKIQDENTELASSLIFSAIYVLLFAAVIGLIVGILHSVFAGFIASCMSLILLPVFFLGVDLCCKNFSDSSVCYLKL